MNISKDCVVTFDYTLRDDGGIVLDTTEGDEPMEYIHGRNELIRGLEMALEGKEAGAVLQDISIAPQDAYGEHEPRLMAEVDRSSFPEGIELEVDMQFEAEGPGGAQIVTITKVDGDTITVDGNHPLAGKTLRFDVKVLGVREATEEEKARGLLRGCGCGCDHGACGDDGCDDCCGGHGHDHCGHC